MGVMIQVTGIHKSEDSNYDVVAFSARDTEEEGMVSFNSYIQVTQACYLAETILNYNDNRAYPQLMRAIAEKGAAIPIGAEFSDE